MYRIFFRLLRECLQQRVVQGVVDVPLVRELFAKVELFVFTGLIRTSINLGSDSTSHWLFLGANPGDNAWVPATTTKNRSFDGTPRFRGWFCGTAGAPPALRRGCSPLICLFG